MSVSISGSIIMPCECF